jgi:integrase
VPKISLSDVGLRSLAPPSQGQVVYWDAKLPCFGIRLSQGGSKTFVLKHDNRRITLGHFPIISLQDARDEAKRLLAEFTLGRLHPQNISVKVAVDDYLAEKAKNRRPRTVQDYRWLLHRHFLFPGRLGDITPAQITHRLAHLPPSQYNHALTAGRIFFNWCRKRRYLTNNPLDALSPYARDPRTRVLSDEELRRIWNCTATCFETPGELPASFARLVQLLILTGLRRGECAHIRSEYVTENLLILPASLTKNRREHILPLTHWSSQLSQTHSSGYVFPGRINSAFNGWSKSKTALDKLSGVTNWTLHDIRRTVATRMAEMGVAPHVIERILNHASGQISGVALVYNRARYIDEMRGALDLWESRLASLLRPSEVALQAAE